MDVHSEGQNGQVDANAPLVIVSCDTHIGPRLKEDLRPYCPAKYLEQFDDFTKYVEGTDSLRTSQEDNLRALMKTSGHYDPHQRMRDLDHDGTAAEVISQAARTASPSPSSCPIRPSAWPPWAASTTSTTSSPASAA